jgi:hypothetical protein
MIDYNFIDRSGLPIELAVILLVVYVGIIVGGIIQWFMGK